VSELRPWQTSLLFHVLCVAFFISINFIHLNTKSTYEVPVVVFEPPEVQNLEVAKEKPKVVLKSVNEARPEAKPTREIFGANRDSYTDENAGKDAVEAKKGNTLAKEVDTTVLLDSDASVLPTPTEEYLVSEMPSVLSEIRPIYPKEAREKQIEGSISLDVLIDDKGLVRQVSVLEGPEIFRKEALIAMKKFRFKPAKVDGNNVAVRIRYTLNFKLEF
jgi:TonB family protein